MITIDLRPGGKPPRPGAPARLPTPPALYDPLALWGIAGAVLLVLVLGGIYLYQAQRLSSLASEIRATEADSTELAEAIRVIEELRAKEVGIQERIGIIRAIDGNRYVPSHLMDEVAGALPAFVWLTRWATATSLPDLSFRLEGIAFSNIQIARFMTALERSTYIGDVTLVSIKEKIEEGIPTEVFSLSCLYESPVAEPPRAPGSATH